MKLKLRLLFLWVFVLARLEGYGQVNTLVYNTPAVFTINVAITPLQPGYVYLGGDTYYAEDLSASIDKPLPAGLVFHTAAYSDGGQNYLPGTITGTPIALSPPTDYTVTFPNSEGNVTAKVNIAVSATAGVTVTYPASLTFQQGQPIR